MLCVKWTAIENQYSMVWRKPEKELFDVCEELGISFVAYSPLGNGFSSGKHTKNTKYDKNDFRSFMGRFKPEVMENNQKLLNELRKLYDIIILDCPPVIGLSDTMIMTKFSDANIIVVSNKKTKIESLDRAKKIFAQANAKITGVVINKASVKGSSYYSYYSDEYYRDTDSKKKRKR